MEELITEQSVTLVGTLFGLVWAFFRSQEWYERAKEAKLGRAIVALEAGVNQTYETYVRTIKEAAADGKLTNSERRRARELARETAITFGRSEGVDVLQEIGRDYMDMWINRLVNDLKANAGKTST